eukprot:41672-Pelagomonas_calceolata.AAC.2
MHQHNKYAHTFQDVAIAAAALPRARGDACIQATGGELLSHQRVNLAGVQALPELALHMVRGLRKTAWKAGIKAE